MTCHELQHFIDHSLPGERALTVLAEAQEHASTCPACAEALTDLLRLEAALTRLSGMEAEEPLTQAVMRRIVALAAAPAPRRANREFLGGTLMVFGTLILAVVYGWTANWSDVLARFFYLSINRSWDALTANGGALRIEVILATLVGAALIVMGFNHAGAEAADVST
jgi:hypothetical protein